MFEESGEGAVSEVGGVDDSAGLIGEDKADSMIERAHTLHFFFERAREVGAEGLRSLLHEPYTPAALIGLERTQSNLAPGPRH